MITIFFFFAWLVLVGEKMVYQIKTHSIKKQLRIKQKIVIYQRNSSENRPIPF